MTTGEQDVSQINMMATKFGGQTQIAYNTYC